MRPKMLDNHHSIGTADMCHGLSRAFDKKTLTPTFTGQNPPIRHESLPGAIFVCDITGSKCALWKSVDKQNGEDRHWPRPKYLDH